jgi:hypothetical protein
VILFAISVVVAMICFAAARPPRATLPIAACNRYLPVARRPQEPPAVAAAAGGSACRQPKCAILHSLLPSASTNGMDGPITTSAWVTGRAREVIE